MQGRASNNNQAASGADAPGVSRGSQGVVPNVVCNSTNNLGSTMEDCLSAMGKVTMADLKRKILLQSANNKAEAPNDVKNEEKKSSVQAPSALPKSFIDTNAGFKSLNATTREGVEPVRTNPGYFNVDFGNKVTPGAVPINNSVRDVGNSFKKPAASPFSDCKVDNSGAKSNASCQKVLQGTTMGSNSSQRDVDLPPDVSQCIDLVGSCKLSSGGFKYEEIINFTKMDLPIPDLKFDKYIDAKHDESQWREFASLHSVERFNQIYVGSKSFSDLLPNDYLIRSMYKMNISRPSPAQELILPLVIGENRRNVIAQAHNGSGKTLTYLLSVIYGIDHALELPQALIIVPTYELVHQVDNMFSKLINGLIIHDTFLAIPQNKARAPVTSKVVIGTLGTVLNLIRVSKHLNCSSITMFVVDEADYMIDAGLEDKNKIISLFKLLPKGCHTMFFSATYPTDVFKYVKSVVNNPVCIQVRKEDLVLPNVQHFYTYLPDCDDLLERFLKNLFQGLSTGTWLCFCALRTDARKMAKGMEAFGFDCKLLTGELPYEDRIRIFSELQSGKIKRVVATDLIARGVDLPEVNLVLQFGLTVDFKKTVDPESYLHRVGRASRYGGRGISIVVAKNDDDLRYLAELSVQYKIKIEKFNPFSEEDIHKLTNIY